MKSLVCLVILITYFTQSFAGTIDTVAAKYKTITYFKEQDSDLKRTDTLSAELDFFHQYNPAIGGFTPYRYLGNLGTAYQNMVYTPNLEFGLRSGNSNNELYSFTSSSTKYFKTKKRYTELKYILGSQAEQQFDIIHTQNVNALWNFGLEFRRISSDGFFENFNSEYNCGRVSTNLHSRNNRYQLLSNFIWNNLTLNQNGGLERDSTLEPVVGLDNLIYPIRLEDAVTKSSTKSGFLKQSFNLGYKTEKKLTDTTSTKVFSPTHQIFHSVFYQQKGSSFKESVGLVAANFYQGNYYNSINTEDTILERRFENRIGWTTLSNTRIGDGERDINLSFVGVHQMMLYKQLSIDTLLETAYLTASFFGSQKSNLYWNLSTSYNVNGSNNGDYSAKGLIRYFIDKNRNQYFEVIGGTQKQSPAFVFNQFDSNHFIWSNNFEKQSVSYVQGGYHSVKYNFDLEGGSSIIENCLFFGTNAVSIQNGKKISVSNVSIHKEFKLFNFVFSGRLIYQRSSNIIRVPELISLNSLFYQTKLFKRALLTQVGVDFRYNSEYKGDAYMPATNKFYMQNARLVGNVPYLDAFMNFKLKTARFFVKMENLISASSGYSSNMVPFYPIPRRAFKFGISWAFFD